jgi:hypothetical protein
MISKLIKLQARAKALSNRLKELDYLYKSGQEDVGRITRLKTTLEAERIEILEELREIMGEHLPSQMIDAIQKAQILGNEKQVKECLKRFAQERGWGKKIIEQVKMHKGDIIDLLISIAIKYVKEITK